MIGPRPGNVTIYMIITVSSARFYTQHYEGQLAGYRRSLFSQPETSDATSSTT